MEEDQGEDVLTAAGQGHLLEGLDSTGQRRIREQARRLNAAYPGGMKAYISNARRLLQASQRGDNPFDGYTPSVPTGERVVYGDERFKHLEAVGFREVSAAAFVLVAGGLGERLGFSGIKLALPATVLTGWTYIELYCRYILAFQAQQLVPDGAAPATIPLVIMTSDDTHEKTLALLEASDYFGLSREQVFVLKQQKVACLVDTDANLGKDPQDPGQIETKPHGHGDVHSLLFASGLARRLREDGKRWLVFFQDTNGLFFRAVLATLGVSAELGLAMNSVAVPRRAKDALGSIARLTHTDGSIVTVNVEYNQLDPLLRSTISPEGDVADPSTGLSPFPGNMNSLVLAMETYMPTLERTGGTIAEFINPKYADDTRTKFKSSTRLECMMQDLPKELPPEARVGFAQFDHWISYGPVKNNPMDALKKFKSGNTPQCGTTGESDLFAANCRILRMLGADIEGPRKETFNGIDVDLEARVVWSPQWAHSLAATAARIAPGAQIKISQRSTLVLDGDIILEKLSLDGALTITARLGSSVRVVDLDVTNDGWVLEPTAMEETGDEVAWIRGFKVRRGETRELVFDSPGEHIVK